MVYLGSKNRISKHILPIILKDRKPGQWYIEPFAGGMNLIDKIGGPRLANDLHPYLIALFRALQSGWIPPSNLTKDEYLDIKLNKEKYADYLVGFVGFGCSYGGKWFGGYATNKENRNYAMYSHNSLLKQIKNLKDVVFTNLDYQDLVIPPNSIIYLDPPYRNATKYSNNFDSEKLYQWARLQANLGHSVYLSEYSAPDDFELLLEIPTNTLLNKNQSEFRIEKLYRVNK